MMEKLRLALEKEGSVERAAAQLIKLHYEIRSCSKTNCSF
jgi:transcription antitermination factor NusA-like protein